MGNHRFRLSDMIPNAWFYKLKEMGNRGSRSPSMPLPVQKGYYSRAAAPTTPELCPPRSPALNHPLLPNRASYYYSTRVEAKKLPSSPLLSTTSDTRSPIDPPRKSNRRSRRRPTTRTSSASSATVVTPSVSAGYSGRVRRTESIAEVPPASPDFPDNHRDSYVDGRDVLDFRKPNISTLTRARSCKLISSATDIIFDLGSNGSFSETIDNLKDSDEVSELQLPPIVTKPSNKPAGSCGSEEKTEARRKEKSKNSANRPSEQGKSQAKRSPPGHHRLRTRANSPRVVPKKAPPRRSGARRGLSPGKSLSESFAVVKRSSDPERDFRESMAEMVVENNIRASKDLEELLACYLSLNSTEHHDTIVRAFEQIWFGLP